MELQNLLNPEQKGKPQLQSASRVLDVYKRQFLLNCELFALTLLFALPLGLVVSFEMCIRDS